MLCFLKQKLLVLELYIKKYHEVEQVSLRQLHNLI
jgi:hypothetical protein